MKSKFPMLRMYISDQKYYIFIYYLACLLGAGLFMLEWKRTSGDTDLGTMIYYIVFVSVILLCWLTINYFRIKPYYESLAKALIAEDPLYAVQLLQDARTSEQQLMKQLLLNQQSMYMEQLDSLRRKQEIQYHFTLQWVHQMKTPVSVIDMLMQQAQDGVKHKSIKNLQEQGELFLSIQEESNRLESGLEMMLHSARVDKLELDLYVRSVPLHEVTRDIINRYKRLCIQYNIFPRIVGEAIASTDQKWFSFVMHQIISNALKYSKPVIGNKTLTIEFEQTESLTTVKVIDQGIGIATSDIRRVFQPFFTGENGRTIGESTGMGLYLAHEVCQRLGHKLTVESQLGEGATFIIAIQSTGIHRL